MHLWTDKPTFLPSFLYISSAFVEFLQLPCYYFYTMKKHFPIVCCGNCVTDGGRSTDNGLQEQLSNRPELHMSKACVVSVRGKGFAMMKSGENKGGELG
jgi:hypothetical protein